MIVSTICQQWLVFYYHCFRVLSLVDMAVSSIVTTHQLVTSMEEWSSSRPLTSATALQLVSAFEILPSAHSRGHYCGKLESNWRAECSRFSGHCKTMVNYATYHGHPCIIEFNQWTHRYATLRSYHFSNQLVVLRFCTGKEAPLYVYTIYFLQWTPRLQVSVRL